MTRLAPCAGWLRQAFSWPEWLLFASLALSVMAVGGPGWAGWAVARQMLAGLGFFVLLKLLDECMDYRHDQAAGRDSFLLRGQASLGDLRALLLAIVAVQGGVTLYACWNTGSAAAALVWSALLACAWLLAHPVLAGRPFLYSLLHYLLLPGFAWWQFALLSGEWRLQSSHLLLMAVFYCGAMQYELSRKLDPVGGYARVLGLGAGCLLIVWFSLLASLAAAALSLFLSGQGWGAALAGAVCALVILVHARLAMRPSGPANKLARHVSGLSLLGLNLTIAACAMQ